jgi:hypothetical protein
VSADCEAAPCICALVSPASTPSLGTDRARACTPQRLIMAQPPDCVADFFRNRIYAQRFMSYAATLDGRGSEERVKCYSGVGIPDGPRSLQRAEPRRRRADRAAFSGASDCRDARALCGWRGHASPDASHAMGAVAMCQHRPDVVGSRRAPRLPAGRKRGRIRARVAGRRRGCGQSLS